MTAALSCAVAAAPATAAPPNGLTAAKTIASYGKSADVGALAGGYGYAAWSVSTSSKRTTLVVRNPKGKLRKVELKGRFDGPRAVVRAQLGTGRSTVAVVGHRCRAPRPCELLAIKASTGRRLDSTPLVAHLGAAPSSEHDGVAVEDHRVFRARAESGGTCSATVTDVASGAVTPLPLIPDCAWPRDVHLRGDRVLLDTSQPSQDYDYHAGGRQLVLDLARPGATWQPLGSYSSGRSSSSGVLTAVFLNGSVFDLYREQVDGAYGDEPSYRAQLRSWTFGVPPADPILTPIGAASSRKAIDWIASTDRQLVGRSTPHLHGGGRGPSRIVTIPAPAEDAL